MECATQPAWKPVQGFEATERFGTRVAQGKDTGCALIMLIFTTDGGAKGGAQVAVFTVPVAMLMTALPATLGALAGAAMGEGVASRRQRAPE